MSRARDPECHEAELPRNGDGPVTPTVHIGAALARARVAAGMTQRELAARIADLAGVPNCGAAMVAEVESRPSVNTATVLRYAIALGVRPTAIFEDAGIDRAAAAAQMNGGAE